MTNLLIPSLALFAVACGSGELEPYAEAPASEAPGAAPAAPQAQDAPEALDALFGELPRECARSEAADRLLKSSMTLDEGSLRPLASAALDAPAALRGVFGAPRVAKVEDDYTSIEIPVQGATLFGLPVAGLITYWGHENGVGGMQVHFAVPRETLEGAVGPRVVDGEWEHPAVSAELSEKGHAVFVCDWSM